MTFNSLIEAAVEFDASLWRQRAWVSRIAYHAEAKGFTEAVDKVWGKPKEAQPPKGLFDLLRDTGGGI